MLADKRIQFGLLVALLEWVIVGGLAVIVGEKSFPMMMLVIIMASAAQLSALFLRWRERGPYTEAQALFMQGRYDDVIQHLDNATDVRSRTLLGNTYRQMGQLDTSEAILREVVAAHPQDAFPLYGLGRTLLVKGDFEEAARWIAASLNQGGRKATAADLALAHYLSGNLALAEQNARRASRILSMEPYRLLMVNYLLQRQDFVAQQRVGIAYWEAEAERFATTPYGERLQNEIAKIKGMT